MFPPTTTSRPKKRSFRELVRVSTLKPQNAAQTTAAVTAAPSAASLTLSDRPRSGRNSAAARTLKAARPVAGEC